MKKSFFLPVILIIALQITQSDKLFSYPKTSKFQNYPEQGNILIQNCGQWNNKVQFLTQSPGMDFWITSDGFFIDKYINNQLINKDNESFVDTKIKSSTSAIHRTGDIVHVKLENIPHNLNFTGNSPESVKRNFFIGNNPDKWITGIQSFNKLKSDNVYKGIDVVITIENELPRYDFIINPGANPRDIKLKFSGQKNIQLSSDKDKLEINTCTGDVYTGKIYAYQDINNQRKKVNCSFTLDNTTASFKLGEYNKNYQLVIDPKIYSTYLGGSGDEEINSCILDKDNNLVVAGWTNSPDFKATTGSYDTIYNNGKDIFISKFSFSGTEKKEIFSTFIGGNLDDIAYGVGVDQNGNIYIAGESNSANYPTLSCYNSQINGKRDIVVSKFNSDGNKLLYSTYLGGEGDDYALALVVGESGAAYITGGTYSTSYPKDASYNIDGNKGREEAFVTKLSPSGTTILYSALMTTTGLEHGTAIAVDENQGTVIVCGATDNSRFYTNPNSPPNQVFDKYYNGGWDGFIAKFGTSGATCEFSGFYGGYNDESINAVMLDKDGNIYIAGQTNSSIFSINPTTQETDFPITTNAYQQKYNGGQECFLAKFDKKCSNILFSTYFGGSGDDVFLSMAANAKRNSIFLTGYSSSSNYPVINDNSKSKYSGGKDIVITEFSTDGTNVIFSGFVGGSGDDIAKNILADSNGDLYLVGSTSSTNFPILKGAVQSNYGGGTKDGFIYKYTFNELSLTKPSKGDEYCAGSIAKVQWSSNGFQSNDKFTLQISTDGGTTWQIAAKDITGYEYDWSIPKDMEERNDYIMQIVHSSGLFAESSGKFTITAPPVINSVSVEPNNLLLCEGDSISFSVIASGKNITYKWRKNGTAITKATDSVFVLSNLTLSDSGKYDVSVGGKCPPDTISQSFQLKIIPKTKITNNLDDKTVKEGKEAVFSVSVVGRGVSYEWQRNKNKIQSSTDSNFTINAVHKTDEGFYRCIVTGDCGSDTTREAQLFVDTLNSVYWYDNINPVNLNIEIYNLEYNRIKIVFSLITESEIKLFISDNKGNMIKEIFNGNTDKSGNEIIFDYSFLSSGIYWLSAECGGNRIAKKLLFLK